MKDIKPTEPDRPRTDIVPIDPHGLRCEIKPGDPNGGVVDPDPKRKGGPPEWGPMPPGYIPEPWPTGVSDPWPPGGNELHSTRAEFVPSGPMISEGYPPDPYRAEIMPPGPSKAA